MRCHYKGHFLLYNFATQYFLLKSSSEKFMQVENATFFSPSIQDGQSSKRIFLPVSNVIHYLHGHGKNQKRMDMKRKNRK